jgi:hypothetical protein
MPNRDHWSASMLLRWVLTRDSYAVLSMVNQYGGWVIEGDNVTRVIPDTWDDVIRSYSIDDSLVEREEPRRWRFTAGFVHFEVFDFARLGGWQR